MTGLWSQEVCTGVAGALGEQQDYLGSHRSQGYIEGMEGNGALFSPIYHHNGSLCELGKAGISSTLQMGEDSLRQTWPYPKSWRQSVINPGGLPSRSVAHVRAPGWDRWGPTSSLSRFRFSDSAVGGQWAPYLQESSRDCRPHQPRAVPSSQLQSLEQEKGRWRVEKAQLEQSVEENKERMEKLEGYWGEAQSLCQAVDEHLRETQAQYQALERKYSKAKRLIKDYQQKYVWGLGALDLRRMERPVVAFPPHPSQLGGPGAQKLEGPVGGDAWVHNDWVPEPTNRAPEVLGRLGISRPENKEWARAAQVEPRTGLKTLRL